MSGDLTVMSSTFISYFWSRYCDFTQRYAYHRNLLQSKIFISTLFFFETITGISHGKNHCYGFEMNPQQRLGGSHLVSAS